MPGYKTHLIGGLVSFSLVYFMSKPYSNFSPELLLFCLAASLVGSLFPDLDTTSKMQYFFYILLAPFLVTALLMHHWIFFICGGAIALILGFIKHRTLFHRPFFLILLPTIIFLWVVIYYPQKIMPAFFITLSFIIGTLSHVALDIGKSKLFKHH